VERGVRSIIAAAALGAVAGAAGCVYPLGFALETWSWGGTWGGAWDRPGDEIRGAGEVVSESRTVRGFGAVSAAGPLRVVLVRNAREQVTITAQENLLPFVETGVHGGVLHVGPLPGVILDPGKEIVVRVECVEVAEISAFGTAAVDADVGWLRELWISLGGDAALTVQGEAERQHVTLSGGSRLDALDLRSERTRARLSGASEAWIWAKDRLEVEAGGASLVRYRGEPVVDARVTAAGSVTRY
jgi:hypothetical protein